MFDLSGKRIFVAGHSGLVGSAFCRALSDVDCTVLTAPRSVLDLRDQAAVQAWMIAHKPDAVIMAAAHVGGIGANIAAPATFVHDNAVMALNVIHSAHLANINHLLFLGSSCMYPVDAPLPLREESLLSGRFEVTNAPYAMAKSLGVEMCRAYSAQYGRRYISAVPCNLYGPQDRYDLERGHVVPALLAKAHLAKMSGARELPVWGSGTPRREFLYSDDCARALLLLLRSYEGDAPVNVGTGEEISIANLARMIGEVTGFKGDLVFDRSHPDGVSSKVMDVSRIHAMGWRAEISLRDGLERAYQDYLCREAAHAA